MECYKTGMLAWSRAGHDKHRLYVIIEVDEEYVYLVDGKIRTLDKPKKKKKKHIQIIYKVPEVIAEKLKTGQAIENEEIKRAIKLYQASCEDKIRR